MPYISYGPRAWGLASKSSPDENFNPSKLRFIFYAKRDKHAVPLLTDADILPLNFLSKSVCCLMHDITNRKVPSTYRPCQG